MDQNVKDEDRQNQSYVEEDEENQEEIDFDQLLGDAARTQVDFDEDRDDYDFEDDMDSLELSNTDQGALKAAVGGAIEEVANQEESKIFQDDRQQMMWEYVIEKYGRKEFEAVYGII